MNGSAVQQCKGDFLVSGIQQTLQSPARNIHLSGCLFLRAFLQIAETQSLQLIDRYLHRLAVIISPKAVPLDSGTDFTFFQRSRHDSLFFCAFAHNIPQPGCFFKPCNTFFSIPGKKTARGLIAFGAQSAEVVHAEQYGDNLRNEREMTPVSLDKAAFLRYVIIRI